jgi:hypothetical protein
LTAPEIVVGLVLVTQVVGHGSFLQAPNTLRCVIELLADSAPDGRLWGQGQLTGGPSPSGTVAAGE